MLNLTSFSELKNNFENYCSSIKSENCINLNGFKIKQNKLVSGNYLPGTLHLNLVLNFQVLYNNLGEISFDFNLMNLQPNETFSFKINGLSQGI